MTYRYAAFVLGITKAFVRVWKIIDEEPDRAPPYIRAIKQLAKWRYKILAKKHHPDMGGSSDKMAELNEAIKCMESLALPKRVVPYPHVTGIQVTMKRPEFDPDNIRTYGSIPFVRVYYKQK